MSAGGSAFRAWNGASMEGDASIRQFPGGPPVAREHRKALFFSVGAG